MNKELEMELHQKKMENEALEREFIPVSRLRPTLMHYDRKFHFSYNQGGTTTISGSGPTVYKAMLDFNRSFYEFDISNINRED